MVSALKGFFNRLAAFNKTARQQRELFPRQKRERFLAVHNSDVAPPEMFTPLRRRMHYETVFFLICSSALLLQGFCFFGKTVIPAFRSVGTREGEMREWVQKLTAKPPTSERDEQNQKLAGELVNLEVMSGRETRSVMVLATAFFAMVFFAFPLLLIWLFVQDYIVFRNSNVARAAFVSRKRWSSSGRISFATADGRQIGTVARVPSYVPIGTKLWVLYSQRSPKRALVYNSYGERTNHRLINR
jgi:hypothetical protein